MHNGLVLSVDHGQVRRDLLQHRDRRRLVVDDTRPLPPAAISPPHDQGCILDIQPIAFQDFSMAPSAAPSLSNTGGNHRTARARAELLGGSFISEQQSESINQDGLPRPGLRR